MQSKRMSLIETVLNVSSGFVISLLLWQFVVCPVWEIERSFRQGIEVTMLFTVASIVRGYLWRRLFNATDKR